LDRETVVTITCGTPATIVTGRILDAESRPMKRTRFAAWLPEPPGIVCSMTQHEELGSRTDADGRFRLRFDVDPGALTVKRLFVSVRSQARGDTRPFGLRAEQGMTFPLRAGSEPGSYDAGDVVFPAIPFLASGRVVSDQGVPVASAELVVMEDDGRGWDQALGLYESRVLSGADGRFEIRADPESRRLGLVANAPLWVCVDPTPFEAGARNVEVKLVRAGGIEGSVAGAGKNFWSRHGQGGFNVVVVGPGAAIAARNDWIDYNVGASNLNLEISDSRFLAKGLPPGNYSVRFTGAHSSDPLLVVDEVLVTPGAVTRDPRLQEVDVTRFLKKRIVTVFDEDGRPLSANVAARTDGRFLRFETGSDGRATILTPEAEGHRGVGRRPPRTKPFRRPRRRDLPARAVRPAPRDPEARRLRRAPAPAVLPRGGARLAVRARKRSSLTGRLERPEERAQRLAEDPVRV
jgi:hypothetical protein